MKGYEKVLGLLRPRFFRVMVMVLLEAMCGLPGAYLLFLLLRSKKQKPCRVLRYGFCALFGMG